MGILFKDKLILSAPTGGICVMKREYLDTFGYKDNHFNLRYKLDPKGGNYLVLVQSPDETMEVLIEKATQIVVGDLCYGLPGKKWEKFLAQTEEGVEFKVGCGRYFRASSEKTEVYIKITEIKKNDKIHRSCR